MPSRLCKNIISVISFSISTIGEIKNAFSIFLLVNESIVKYTPILLAIIDIFLYFVQMSSKKVENSFLKFQG